METKENKQITKRKGLACETMVLENMIHSISRAQSVKEQVKSPVRLGEPSVASSSGAQGARVNGVGANQAGVRSWTTRMRSCRTYVSQAAERCDRMCVPQRCGGWAGRAGVGAASVPRARSGVGKLAV